MISIYTNGTRVSLETQMVLKDKLLEAGFVVPEGFNPDSELLVCIGGDGSTLESIHKFGFPKVPIVGINTGHLGFFQEIHPTQLDEFILNYKEGRYRLQPLATVKAHVSVGKDTFLHRGLNEIVIKSGGSSSAHLNISIDGSFIERFSGDGILIASPAGSTAYNYSLGGAIVDPRLRLLQVTPIAPMNTTAYRSFTSSLLLPSDLFLEIAPEYAKDNSISITSDGIVKVYEDVALIKVELSQTVVNLLRFETYDFWNKVKTKFL